MNTIVSLITPRFKSAVAIIRLSGDDAFSIINKIIEKPIHKPEKATIYKNKIIDKNKKVIDDVLLMSFVSPKSFTGCDTIEINCHGNLLIIDKIIDLCLENGAKLAQRGEFSKQAFLNNKIDIIQANSINSLINSNNQISNNISLNGILGKYSNKLVNIKDELFNIIGNTEVSIDYPEYEDIEQFSKKDIKKTLNNIKEEFTKAISHFNKYKYLYNGINLLIIGKTNSGKSSLFNSLLKEDRSIVSDIKGTTRDYIKETIYIEDLVFNIIDTAGFNNSNDYIEQQGIKKINDLVSKADLIIYLIDSSKKISKNELKQIQSYDQNKTILVKNKCDLDDKNIELKAINISAKNNDINDLLKEIKKRFKYRDQEQSLFISTNEELLLFNDIINDVNITLDILSQKYSTLDLIISYIETIHHKILKILGLEKDFDLLDNIFKNFCLGK